MKAKKSAPKKAKNSLITMSTTRALVAFLIILLASSIFLLFNTYQTNIVANNMFYPFMILTFIGMGLLVVLLFLTNPSYSKKK